MRLLLLLISMCFLGAVTGQNLSGVVNTYYPVSAVNINEATLTVSNTSGISIGDTLFLIQMQGATLDQSNSQGYGDVSEYGGAGNYERVEVCDVQGNDVILKTKLEKFYSAEGTQLISFPSAQQIDVNGTVTAIDWNGSSGGVVVIRAYGTLTLNAGIDVSEQGFRGGGHFYAADNCNFLSDFDAYEYDLASSLGAYKGEGIAAFTTMNCGRGAWANGGGGGNDHNAGGAGGGNVVRGGNGGDNDDPGTFRCKGYYPGVGGKPLDYTEGRVFMGGGGGGGHSNSSPNPYVAGNGGGIIFLFCDQLVSNNQALLAHGGDGEDGIGDGGAGGGAGGSFFLEFNSFSGNLNVLANGGDGGNGDGAVSVTNVNTDRCFGPGGGGAGGFISLSSSGIPGGLTPGLTAGVSGVVSGSTHTPCLGLTQGAEDGEVGVISFSNEIVMGRKINSFCTFNPQLDIGNDTVLCPGETVTYSSNIVGSYDWNTGAITQSITVGNSGTYLLEVDDGLYIYCDSAEVSLDVPVQIDLGGTRYMCDLDPITLSAPPGFNQYLWSTGETTQSITVNSEGEYSVEVSGQYCNAQDTVDVINEPYQEIFREDKAEICSEDGVSLDAIYPGGTYQWSTGETGQIIIVKEPADISVDVVSAAGCTYNDQIEIIPCTSIGIPNTITPNGDGFNDTWVIKSIYAFPLNQVAIYDRSGRLVYDKKGYTNDWDGKGLPATVYYYEVILDPEFDAQKGTITIIRE